MSREKAWAACPANIVDQISPSCFLVSGRFYMRLRVSDLYRTFDTRPHVPFVDFIE